MSGRRKRERGTWKSRRRGGEDGDRKWKKKGEKKKRIMKPSPKLY